jgi:hypothetical protein
MEPTGYPAPDLTITGVEAHRRSLEHARQMLRRRRIDPGSRASLLHALATRTTPDHLLLIFEVLQHQSIPRSFLPQLRRLCTFPSHDIQGAAQHRLVRMVSRAEGVALLRSLLTNRRCCNKWSVIAQLCTHGYRADVPAVVHYVRDSLARRYGLAFAGPGTIHSHYCAFLDEFLGTHPAVRPLYAWMAARWKRFEPPERESFKRRQPFLGHHSGRKWVLFVTSHGIGGIRLPNVFYNQIPAFGLSLLPLSSPRFAAAFRTLAAEADLIVPIGPRALRRAQQLHTHAHAPIHPHPTPDYERHMHPTINWPRDMHQAAWNDLAKAEDPHHIAAFRTTLDAAAVRHPRPRPPEFDS